MLDTECKGKKAVRQCLFRARGRWLGNGAAGGIQDRHVWALQGRL